MVYTYHYTQHLQVIIMHADHRCVWLVHLGGLLSVWSAEDRMLLCEPLKCFNSNITYALESRGAFKSCLAPASIAVTTPF